MDENKDLENIENIEDIEDIESIENSETIEDVEEIDTTEAVEEIETIETIEDVEAVENTEIAEAIEEIEDIEETSQIEQFEEVEETQELTSFEEPKIQPTIAQDEDLGQIENNCKELITVRPVKFQTFEATEPNRTIKKNLDILQDISMHVSVELGRTKSSIREVIGMEIGSVVELDKIAGEQVEIFINEKLVAKGEVIVIEDKFGVRVTSTNIAKAEA